VNKVLKYLAVSAALAMTLAACNQDTKAGGKGTTAASGGGAVLAEVNGEKITTEDFKAEAVSISPYAAQALADPKTREKFLDSLISKRLFVQDALKKGYDKDPELVKALNQTKETLLTREYLKKEVVEKSTATDKDIKDFFDKNKADMGSVRLSHILVKTEAEARSVKAKLDAGEPFAKLAKQYSQDASTKDKGGDLGYVEWSQLGSQSLKDAAFKLHPGDVGGIVQSSNGYHVVKVTDKKPAKDAQFDSMKATIKQDLDVKKRETLLDSVVKGLRDKAKVTTNSDALKDVSFQDAKAPGDEHQEK